MLAWVLLVCGVGHVTGSRLCVQLPATPTLRGTVAANDLLLGELRRRVGETLATGAGGELNACFEPVDLSMRQIG